MKEIWKAIEGYCGKYEVSNLGRVRSCFNGIQRELKQMVNAGRYNGYPMVTLYAKPNCGKKVKVHRLVAEAFIPNPNGYDTINHKDENRANNSVDNLEWCTKAYNTVYNGARQRATETRR